MQNTEGVGDESSLGFFETGAALYHRFGPGVFYDGISSKVLRAAVNHAVTFFVYDLILSSTAVATSQ